MEKIKILIVYCDNINRVFLETILGKDASIKTQSVSNLKEALEMSDGFDLVMTDIDHPWYKNEEILDEGESIELFLNHSLIVFNFIKKLNVKCILGAGFPKNNIQDKLLEMGVTDRVFYVLIPLLPKDWISEIKKIVKPKERLGNGNCSLY